MAASQSTTALMNVRFEKHKVEFDEEQLSSLRSELRKEKVVTVEFIYDDSMICRCEVKKAPKNDEIEPFFTLTSISKDGELLPVGHSTVFQNALYSSCWP